MIRGRMIAILSGNFEEAKLHAKTLRLNRNEWFYISTAERLDGCQEIDVHRVGSYFERRDLQHVEKAIALAFSGYHAEPR